MVLVINKLTSHFKSNSIQLYTNLFLFSMKVKFFYKKIYWLDKMLNALDSLYAIFFTRK